MTKLRQFKITCKKCGAEVTKLSAYTTAGCPTCGFGEETTIEFRCPKCRNNEDWTNHPAGSPLDDEAEE